MSHATKTPQVRKATIPVAGMTCASCERRVGKALLKLPGVQDVQVNSKTGKAFIEANSLPPMSDIAAALHTVGYELGHTPLLSKDKTTWITFGVTSAILIWLVWAAGALGITGIGDGLTDLKTGGLALVVILGLAAGVSTCMAMVGGLVLGFTANHAATLASQGQTSPSFLKRMQPQFAFNAGRILGFFAGGVILGAIGGAAGLPTNLTALLMLAVAAVMLMLGLRLTGIAPKLDGWNLRLPGSIGRALRLDEQGGGMYSHWRTGLVGAATFLLPCGFTQAVQLYALTLGSPLTSGVAMALFAVGTTPGLLALGAIPEIASGNAQKTILRVIGVVVLGFALLNANNALHLLGVINNAPAAVISSASGAGVKSGEIAKISDNVTVTGNTQTVRMTQLGTGYSPTDTTVYAGMPIKWEIEGTAPYSCSMALTVPSLGVRTNIAEGANTVDLPALEEGVTPFSCIMGMYGGNLIAVPKPAGGAAETATKATPSGPTTG